MTRGGRKADGGAARGGTEDGAAASGAAASGAAGDSAAAHHPDTPTSTHVRTSAPAGGGTSRLAAESVTLAYDQRVIAENLSVAIPDHSFTVIVGPNACGKSTLLRALSRLLKPAHGQRCCSTAGRSGRCRPRPWPGRSACSRRAGGARRDHRVRARVPRPLPAPGAAAAVVGRGRADRRRIDGRDRHGRARGSLCRRALRRPAAAGVDRDGAGAADSAAAARRADHVSRHPAPDRRARPVRRTARAARPYPGGRPPRPQPGRAATPPISSPCGTAGSGAGAAGRDHHRRAGGGRLRACAAGSSRTRRAVRRWWCPRPGGQLQQRAQPQYVPHARLHLDPARPQALAKFSSPPTRATRSSPVIVSRIWAFPAGSPGTVMTSWIRLSVSRPTKVMPRSLMRQLSERSKAVAPRTPCPASARFADNWSSALRHSSMVAIG